MSRLGGELATLRIYSMGESSLTNTSRKLDEQLKASVTNEVDALKEAVSAGIWSNL